jgi:transcriptional regulator
MYSPSAFSITDPSVIRTFVEQNSFGVLVSFDGEHLHDTHTPLLISEDLTLITGHIARANRQWQTWADHPAVKVVFHGPHSYISPRFYKSEFNVPTWNYSAISVDGKITIIEDRQASIQIVQDLISKHEGPSGWKLNLADERYLKLFDAVVCFSIEIEEIDAKFKLNQNKSEEDQQSVVAHLLESANLIDHQTAELMTSVKEGQ